MGAIRRCTARPEFAEATFQVASQFNLLEIVRPGITSEDGVTRYSGDRTQRPACAIAAGARMIYRNYFVPVGGVWARLGTAISELSRSGVTGISRAR